MDVAAFVVSVIALGVAFWAAWYARREAHAAEDAAREATRSADAAQEAISYQRDEVERSRVVFELYPATEHEHVLENTGTDTAYGVHVDTGDLGVEPVTDYDEFRAGQREPYLLARSVASSTTHIVVTWHMRPDRSDPAQEVRLLAF